MINIFMLLLFSSGTTSRKLALFKMFITSHYCIEPNFQCSFRTHRNTEVYIKVL
jgi:hypothetical protein